MKANDFDDQLRHHDPTLNMPDLPASLDPGKRYAKENHLPLIHFTSITLAHAALMAALADQTVRHFFITSLIPH